MYQPDKDLAEDFKSMGQGRRIHYNVILGLPDGTVVLRRECITEVGELWCRISLASAPGLTGFVAARYLSEART